jgi:hypothetical protein
MNNKYEDINQAYLNVLTRSEANIVFDAHSMKITKDSIDAKVVDMEITNALCTSWEYTAEVIRSENSQKIYTLGEYVIDILRNHDFQAFEWYNSDDVTPLKKAKNLKGAHAGKIMGKIHNAFKMGLINKYCELASKQYNELAQKYRQEYKTR